MIIIITIIIKIPKSTTATNIQIHHFNTTFVCERSIVGVLFDSVGRFQDTLLLCTTCMRSQRLGRASSVADIPANKQTNNVSQNKTNFATSLMTLTTELGLSIRVSLF